MSDGTPKSRPLSVFAVVLMDGGPPAVAQKPSSFGYVAVHKIIPSAKQEQWDSGNVGSRLRG
jgi:hypothetical protein